MNPELIYKYQREIHYENELLKIHNKLTEKVIPQLQEFMGKKITTLKGLSSKVTDKIHFPDFNVIPLKDGYAKLNYCYLYSYYNSLYIKYSIVFNGGSYDDNTYYCDYRDSILYVGNINDNILDKICEITITPLINEKMELEKIEKYFDLKKQMDEIHSRILIKL